MPRLVTASGNVLNNACMCRWTTMYAMFSNLEVAHPRTSAIAGKGLAIFPEVFFPFVPDFLLYEQVFAVLYLIPSLAFRSLPYALEHFFADWRDLAHIYLV